MTEEETVEVDVPPATDPVVDDDASESRPVREGAARASGERAAIDSAAESFLELEADLDGQLSPDDDGPDQSRGLVVDAERVEVDTIPEGYPVEFRTERAIALQVDRGDGETTVYLEWPGDDGAAPSLPWLLTAMDIDLSDLYGRQVLLEHVDGHDILVVPTEHPHRSDAWGPGLMVAHVVNAGLLGLQFTTAALSTPLYGLWALLTVAIVPYLTYRDAWYVRTHSDWDGGPLFWAALSMLPMLNPLAGVAYFRSRSRARFFGDGSSLLDTALVKVRSWL